MLTSLFLKKLVNALIAIFILLLFASLPSNGGKAQNTKQIHEKKMLDKKLDSILSMNELFLKNTSDSIKVSYRQWQKIDNYLKNKGAVNKSAKQ